MGVASSIADSQNPTQSPSTARLTALKLAILQFFEPGVLPVLALALMVGGWSYGKKLSHYFHNTHVTKASTTRMWLDHRNDAATAPVAIHQVEHKFLTPQLSIISVPESPHFSRQQLVAEPAAAGTTEFVSPLHPLRAPPISSLQA